MAYETKNNITLGDFPTLDPEEWRTDTGVPEFHSVQTIELGQLIDSKIFTWGYCYWGDVAYSPEQYARVCQAFEDRFWLREIGITPVKAWMRKLRYTLRVELCPKYNPLYAQIEAGEYDPLQNGGKFVAAHPIQRISHKGSSKDLCRSSYKVISLFGSQGVVYILQIVVRTIPKMA